MFYLYLSLAILGIFILLCVIQKLCGVECCSKKAIWHIVIGISAIAAVNLLGKFTAVFLPVSLLSLGLAAVGGIPAVTMMLLLNLVI